MRNWIFTIGLIALGCISAVSLYGFKDVETTTFEKRITLTEFKAVSELSSRIDIEAYVPTTMLSDKGDDDESSIIFTKQEGDSYFQVEEFTAYDKHPSQSTLNKIKNIHIPELLKVRDKLGIPIVIRSASRTFEHELAMGRSGKSMHVYSNGLGAVDVSTNNYTVKELNTLENILIDYSNYNRITRYETFIHLDFAENRFGGRGYYRNTKYGWIYVGKVK